MADLAIEGTISIGLLVRLLLSFLWGELDQIINPDKIKESNLINKKNIE